MQEQQQHVVFLSRGAHCQAWRSGLTTHLPFLLLLSPCLLAAAVPAVVSSGQEWCECKWSASHAQLRPLQPGFTGEDVVAAAGNAYWGHVICAGGEVSG